MTLFSSSSFSPFSLRRLDRWLAPWMPWLIVALAVGLRFWRLDAQSLWADEGNSASLALRSWSDTSGPTQIFNLGHGISQYTPPENVAVLVEAVHAHSRAQRA